jgi:D-lactate dehydrogenase
MMACVFSCQAVAKLAKCGVKVVAMRCAGFDRVDLEACQEHGIKVVRVPTYSPTSVAEHAVGLLFAVNR